MIPQPKFSQIIDELNEIAHSTNKEQYIFRLNGFKNNAQDMLKSLPVEANTILGAISSLENNIDLMHKFHRAALNYSNNSKFALFQYAISLSNSNLLNEAYKYFLEAHNTDSYDPNIVDEALILKHLMSICYFLNKDTDFEKYKKMLEKLKAEFVDPALFIEDDDEALGQMFSAADKIMEQNPHLISKPDPELMDRIEKLVDGVDLS